MKSSLMGALAVLFLTAFASINATGPTLFTVSGFGHFLVERQDGYHAHVVIALAEPVEPGNLPVFDCPYGVVQLVFEVSPTVSFKEYTVLCENGLEIAGGQKAIDLLAVVVDSHLEGGSVFPIASWAITNMTKTRFWEYLDQAHLEALQEIPVPQRTIYIPFAK